MQSNKNAVNTANNAITPWDFLASCGHAISPLEKVKKNKDGTLMRGKSGKVNEEFKVCKHWKEQEAGKKVNKKSNDENGYAFIPRNGFCVLDADYFIDCTKEEVMEYCNDKEIPFVITYKGVHVYGYSRDIPHKGVDDTIWNIGPFKCKGEWRAWNMGYVVGPGSPYYYGDIKDDSMMYYTPSESFVNMIEESSQIPDFSIDFVEGILANYKGDFSTSDRKSFKVIDYAKELEGFEVETKLLRKMMNAVVSNYFSYGSVDKARFKNCLGLRVSELYFRQAPREEPIPNDIIGRNDALLDVVSIWVHVLLDENTPNTDIPKTVMFAMKYLYEATDSSGVLRIDHTDFSLKQCERIVNGKLSHYIDLLDWHASIDFTDEQSVNNALAVETNPYRISLLKTSRENMLRNLATIKRAEEIGNSLLMTSEAINEQLGYTEDEPVVTFDEETMQDVVDIETVNVSENNNQSYFSVDSSIPMWKECVLNGLYSTYADYLQARIPHLWFNSDSKEWYNYNSKGGYWGWFKGDEFVIKLIREILIRDNMFNVEVVNKKAKWLPYFDEYKTLVSGITRLRAGPLWASGGAMRNKVVTLFLCREGVVDMKTGNLLPHGPEYEFIAPATVSYKGLDYNTDRFAKIISDFVQHDNKTEQELADRSLFLQMMFGLGLTADMRVNKMFIISGVAGSGKTTIMDSYMKVVGGYGTAMKLGDIDDKYAMTSLIERRCCFSDEVGERRINTNKLKSLITGSPMIYEEKYQTDRTFKPEVKFVLACNELPNFTDGDKSLLDRLAPIEITRRVRGTEHDHKGFVNFLQSDAIQSEILTWAIQGYHKLETNDMSLPVMSEEFETLREIEMNSDSVKAFLGDEDFLKHKEGDKKDWGRTERGDGWFMTRDELFNLYELYCDYNRTPAMYRLNRVRFMKRCDGVLVQHRYTGHSRGFYGLMNVYEPAPIKV